MSENNTLYDKIKRAFSGFFYHSPVESIIKTIPLSVKNAFGVHLPSKFIYYKHYSILSILLIFSAGC